ncbi:MAG: carbamoyltransferase HypF [Candidatus Omnitrophica bacterium]|nr:carbamoyltransferase HypF [Candidatus Omnitrophota bacterium]
MDRSNRDIKLPLSFSSPVLAVGSESKSGFAVLSGDRVSVSRIFSDLKDPAEFDSYKKAILSKKKSFERGIIAHDLHPEYMSTKYAGEIFEKIKRKSKGLAGVQHHHAHIAACMAENGLQNKVIGVAFDGTGYGLDGNIWGGEFMIADYGGFERKAHLAYVPMPGGDKAVLEPMRMALSYIYKAYGRGIGNLSSGVLRRMGKARRSLLLKIIDKGLNSPLTSSAGRLFDAVSSLIGIRDRISFEGEAAIELEKIAVSAVGGIYGFKIEKRGKEHILDFSPMIKMIISDLNNKKRPGLISRKFHNTVAEAIKDTALKLRDKTKLKYVVLSGGVFQNKILSYEARVRLERAHFSVYTHSKTSCADSGLPIGQAVIAASKGE